MTPVQGGQAAHRLCALHPAATLPDDVRGATLFAMRTTESPVSGVLVPDGALAAGFSNSPIGTHTGKTMMLPELRLLLSAVRGPVEFADYQRATIDENALAKSTAANRGSAAPAVRRLSITKRKDGSQQGAHGDVKNHPLSLSSKLYWIDLGLDLLEFQQ